MITLLLLARATYMYGVVLHAHPVRGESHNQRNTTGEVATLLITTSLQLNQKKSLTRRSMQYAGPRLWNNIPKDLRNKSFSVFCST